MSIAATPESIELFKILTETKKIMNTKHTIDIPGLPEGWRAVAYRRPIEGEYFFDKNGGISLAGKDLYSSGLIIEKIKPHRIVLEEISKEEYHRLFNDERCSDIYNMRGSYWRLVEEE